MRGKPVQRALFGVVGALITTFLINGCVVPPGVPPTTTTTTAPPPLLLDQENNPDEYVGTDGAVLADCDDLRRMQTFTAGRTGLLEQVSIPLLTYVSTPPPLIITVHPLVDADTPDLTVELGRGTYDGAGLGEFVFPPSENPTDYIDVAIDAVTPVTAGTQYALVLRVDPAECVPGGDYASWASPFRYSAIDSYQGGGLYLAYGSGEFQPSTGFGSTQFDLIFQTWVR